jgi:hypothetical protein
LNTGRRHFIWVMGLRLSALSLAGVLWIQPVSADEPSSCDSLLRTFVVDGLVDYDRLIDDPLLGRCVGYVRDVDVDRMSDKNTRLAFWINAYNITVIKSVIHHGIPHRVTDVRGFFSDEKHEVAGRSLTLDEIENGVIRPFGDARIHAALVCAALSCPELQAWAFASDSLDHQLNQVSRKYLADRSRNIIDLVENSAQLSKVFDWYGGDFVTEYGSVMAFVWKYGPENESRASTRADDMDSFEPQYLNYDWSLNRFGATE